MPELPEVETMARGLRRKITGLTVEEVRVFDRRVIADFDTGRFVREMTGAAFRAVERRGKGIIITLDRGKYLFVQVKMTGYFVYGPDLRENGGSGETKVIFRLSNGDFLNYNDQRLFGWLYLVDRLEDIPYLTTIGPEPLGKDFSVAWLTRELKKRSSPIKPLLMNQQFIAGIGNIYASEILFSAKVNPRKRARQLTRRQIEDVHRHTVSILEESIRLRGTSMRNYRDAQGRKGRFMDRIRVYGKQDEDCPECSQPIIRIVQAQRSTFYCKHCQK